MLRILVFLLLLTLVFAAGVAVGRRSLRRGLRRGRDDHRIIDVTPRDTSGTRR